MVIMRFFEHDDVLIPAGQPGRWEAESRVSSHGGRALLCVLHWNLGGAGTVIQSDIG